MKAILCAIVLMASFSIASAVTYNWEEDAYGTCQQISFVSSDCPILVSALTDDSWELNDCTESGYSLSNCKGKTQEDIDNIGSVYAEYCDDPSSLVYTLECQTDAPQVLKFTAEKKRANDADLRYEGLWYYVGLVKDGSPYYDFQNEENYFLYFDKDCGATGYAARWLIDTDRPAVDRDMNLDSDTDGCHAPGLYQTDDNDISATMKRSIWSFSGEDSGTYYATFTEVADPSGTTAPDTTLAPGTTVAPGTTASGTTVAPVEGTCTGAQETQAWMCIGDMSSSERACPAECKWNASGCEYSGNGYGYTWKCNPKLDCSMVISDILMEWNANGSCGKSDGSSASSFLLVTLISAILLVMF